MRGKGSGILSSPSPSEVSENGSGSQLARQLAAMSSRSGELRGYYEGIEAGQGRDVEPFTRKVGSSDRHGIDPGEEKRSAVFLLSLLNRTVCP